MMRYISSSIGAGSIEQVVGQQARFDPGPALDGLEAPVQGAQQPILFQGRRTQLVDQQAHFL